MSRLRAVAALALTHHDRGLRALPVPGTTQRAILAANACTVLALLAFGMWAFLHTKTGTAMTAVGSNPVFARASGIDVDRIRLLSVIMSTWLAAVGILVYEQGFGFIQLYEGPLYMAFPAVSAILIGGAGVNKATLTHVVIGAALYQGITLESLLSD